MAGKTDNQLLRDLARRIAVFSDSLKIVFQAGQSNSDWVELPVAAPKFASLRAPKDLPASVTKLTLRLRNEESDTEGYKLYVAGAEREILLPEPGIIIEPNELIGISPYLNEKLWQLQIRLDDTVVNATSFYLDTA